MEGIKSTGCEKCDKRFAAGKEYGCKTHQFRMRLLYERIKPESIDHVDFAEPWITRKIMEAAAAYQKRYPQYRANRVLQDLAKEHPKYQAWAAYNFADASRRITERIHKAASLASLCRNEHL